MTIHVASIGGRAARATGHSIWSFRRVGGDLLDRIQLVLARIDHSLGDREFEPYSMRAPKEIPPHVAAMIDHSAAGPSEWRDAD